MKQEKPPPRPAAGRATRTPRNPVRIIKPRRAPPDDSRLIGSLPDFVPASPRERHDGWTPDKQVAFIDALAESGCVTEACARVGQAPSTAYRMGRRAGPCDPPPVRRGFQSRAERRRAPGLFPGRTGRRAALL